MAGAGVMTKLLIVSSASSMRLIAGLFLAALATVARRCARGEVTACPAGDDGFRSPSAVSHYLEARLAGLRGDHLREAEELRLALALDDGSAELRAAHAEALASAGRIDAAEAEARLAVACDGDGTSRGVGPPVARPDPGGEAARSSRRWPSCAPPWPSRRRGRPGASAGDPGGLAAGGRAAGRDAATSTAPRRRWRRRWPRIGTDGGGFRELGRTLLERREMARAERPLRRAIELDRGDLEGWRMLAQVDEVLRQRAEARVDWMALLRLDPENADALLGLGRLALLDDDLAAGEEWFRRHLRAAGEGPEPRLRVALEWLEARRPEEALRLAREGLTAAPGDPRLRLVAGLALQELRRWRESAAMLGEVTPGAGELWFSARATMA